MRRRHKELRDAHRQVDELRKHVDDHERGHVQNVAQELEHPIDLLVDRLHIKVWERLVVQHEEDVADAIAVQEVVDFAVAAREGREEGLHDVERAELRGRDKIV